jgi:hypothetical protein
MLMLITSFGYLAIIEDQIYLQTQVQMTFEQL